MVRDMQSDADLDEHDGNLLRDTERCEVCGFEWDAIDADEVPDRIVAAAGGLASVLRNGGDATARRPAVEVWSVVEYGCHVRDVLYNLRDRIVVGLAEDDPVPKAMFTDTRIAARLYAGDQPATLATELELAGGLFARTVAALDREQMARPIFYGWPRPATRTLLWVAAQALHEAEHHLADVRAAVESAR